MHLRCLGALAFDSVDSAGQFQIAPIEAAGDSGTGRAKGIEPLGPAPLAVGLLQISAGDVVHADVSTDRPFGQVRISVSDPSCDHHPDLPLELHPLGDARQQDWLTWSN